MKKILLLLISIFLSFSVYSQSIKSLNSVSTNETISGDNAIIYGTFIQRLGFSSGGFPQDIRIMNVETKEVFSFRVKPTFKSAKENDFIYFLAPGKYIILNYWWTQSKWYGGTMFTEPIYKDIDATVKLEKKIKSGELQEEDFVQFSFTISENTINYLGTWHFDKGLVSFTDEKTKLDNKISDKFKKIDFMNAKTVLPN
jgi:hypothetical protein